MGRVQQREAFMGRGSCRAGGSPACRAILRHFSFSSASLCPGTHPETLTTQSRRRCLCNTVTTDNPGIKYPLSSVLTDSL
ncbi:hypothetical protein QQF64_002612 [Cirrhinus molitorella]|uniref:Uncharacterized protein n=1 Tax=Cirrhinus molitorella TaxID=172907 RepID=A0ABR3MQM3_9TELE